MIERLCDTVVVVIFFAISLMRVSAPAGNEAEFAQVRYIGLGLLGPPLPVLLPLVVQAPVADAISGLEKWLKKLGFIPNELSVE